MRPQEVGTKGKTMTHRTKIWVIGDTKSGKHCACSQERRGVAELQAASSCSSYKSGDVRMWQLKQRYKYARDNNL